MKPRILLLSTDQGIGRTVSDAIAHAIPDVTIGTHALDSVPDLSFADYVLAASDQLQLLVDESRTHATEEADITHEQLLGVLFHELRTPLTPILAWAQLLKRTNDPARIEMGADVIERNVRTQMSLIDDVLDINRLRRRSLTLTLRRQDLGPLIQDAVQPSSAAAAEKGVQIRLALAPANALEARIDGARIKQIVTSLVTNAVRFTSRGGSVIISSERDSNFGIVAVVDTGLAIEPADLPFIFDPRGSCVASVRGDLRRSFRAGPASVQPPGRGAGLDLGARRAMPRSTVRCQAVTVRGVVGVASSRAAPDGFPGILPPGPTHVGP